MTDYYFVKKKIKLQVILNQTKNQIQLIMKKFALLLFLLNVSFLFAQKEISGVVKDNTGMA